MFGMPMKLLEELPHLRVFEHVAERRAVETEGNLLRAVVALLGGRLRALDAFTTVGLVVIVTTAGKTCSAAA